ncbi:hypothetical protein BXY85_0971 [Roseivirga pacifica]|uniref:Uncharacterized protein n=1 Tax=Roseivirga pacifica TaxID=1267423 RepID=A0A1I0RP52_9BACT|nr:hypothetical protein [Roseivirga pacifica]RKQ49969.1 hypothetical protein BXY85_0971 [Roseivirga pacifica]SEW43027.1 hypothetical protein SAMN05216290_3919 [Roseivirga pacifica]
MFDFLNEVDWPQAIVVSTATSFIFLLFLTLFRPRLRLSKIILFETLMEGDGEECKPVFDEFGKEIVQYKFKAVNWTFTNLIENKIELNLVTRYGDGDGTYSVRTEKIRLKREEVLDIPCMNSIRGFKNARYAHIFVTYEDLKKKWNKDSQYLELRILSKHGLSGYTRLKSKRYTDRSVLKEGNFKYGIWLKKKDH